MADSWFEGQGGLDLGGFGEFTDALPPGCNLVLCEGGCIDSLERLVAVWEGFYKAGLYQNDVTPVLATVLGSLVRANFSGYVGEQLLVSWNAPAMAGFKAETMAAALIWTHDGGPMQNWVYGYYVVNQSNELIWAERFCPSPLPMNGFGQRIRIRPRFRLGTEFPE